jgi:hypothetical protein
VKTRLRRYAVASLIASLALNAALGIYALLAGDFGDLEEQILLTSVTVSAVGVVALACAPARERGLLGAVPTVGMAAAPLAGALFVAAIWLDSPPDALFRAGGTAAILAVVGVHASLLALAPLPARHRWARAAAIAFASVLGALAVSLVWGDWDSGAFGRAFGVVAVLLAAFTLLVPILARTSRGKEPTAAEPEPVGAIRFCPSCGHALEARPGEASSCPACGVRFEVLAGTVPGRRGPLEPE